MHIPREYTACWIVWFGRRRGQGLVEYALIIALVSIVVVAALILLGPHIAIIFKSINNSL
ncbi:MAG: Flp family type IVb pilin [Ktedonobacterales bacterium]